MKTNSIVYITFALKDINRVKARLTTLEMEHQTVLFLGRHQIGFPGNPQEVADSIAKSTVTLVFVSRNTEADETVEEDVKSSLAKTSPNRLMAVFLDEEVDFLECSLLGGGLAETGAEQVKPDGDVDGALFRTLLLAERARKIVESAGRPPTNTTCSR